MNPIEKENIQNSFKKIKEEMLSLTEDILFLKKQLGQTNKTLNQISSYLSKQAIKAKESSTSSMNIQQISQNPAHNPPYNQELSPEYTISIGNRGVPADSQQTVSRHIIEEKEFKPSILSLQSSPSETIRNIVDKKETEKELANLNGIKDMKDLSLILEELKKELKRKFKNLTNQELLIFSLVYTLNEEQGEVSYKDISLRANLTESSVRDYISRLEHKGIPLIKEKKNNKMIIIKIPDELKHLSTLDNLTKLSKNS